jgi:hypothetical protein
MIHEPVPGVGAGLRRLAERPWPWAAGGTAGRRAARLPGRARGPGLASGRRRPVLHDKPWVLALPLDRCLAGEESVALDDIAGEPLPRTRPGLGRFLARRSPARRQPRGHRRQGGRCAGSRTVRSVRLRDQRTVPSHKLTVPDLLVEVPCGLRWLEPGFVAELPLALVVLMYRQVRLVEARIAAH